jgi:hypothetical protein
MDFYGRGHSPIRDKIDAIRTYKYHIAIESCNLENYWTEKLTDAWVGWSLPVYCGDPSITERIPDPRGIEVIDIRDIGSAIQRVESILYDDPYESRLDAIGKCREWAISESNPYERACRIIESSGERTQNTPANSETELICRKASYRTTFVFDCLAAVLGRKRSKELFSGYKHMQSRFKG